VEPPKSHETAHGSRHRRQSRGSRPGHLVRPAKNTQPLVLIVDDDVDARMIYSTYLRAMGCVVFTAPDGMAAVEKAEALLPDLIVIDLAMPRLDGWLASRQLKSSTGTRAIPILALSAVETAHDSAHAAGCVAFLSKPCMPELLWWQIRLVLKLDRM